MSERIIIAEDDEDLAFVLREALRRQRYDVDVAPTAGGMLDGLKTSPYDLILLDVRLPDMDGLDAIPRCRELAPDTPIIVMTAHGTRETAMEAITRGAYDFFTKPLKMDEFQVVVARALDRRRLQKQVKALRDGQPSGLDGLIGQSEGLKRVVDMAHRAAPTDLTILVQGESGTGKEVLARAIHRLSARKDGPFVPVNCAAIPPSLVESELFGHARGAFTGATTARAGRFAQADGGTIFLDEIGEMELGVQAKLLRLIQDGELYPVGEEVPQKIDVRILAATNRKLENEVAAGRFRADLFWRLNVIPVELPSLRQRASDIPALCQAFIARANEKNRRNVTGMDADALKALRRHGWPGNIRELENLIERLVIMRGSGLITLNDLPATLRTSRETNSGVSVVPDLPDEGTDLRAMLEQVEERMIAEALERTGGNKNRAAELLGLNRTTLVEKLRRRRVAPSA
jgi:DNA-binding NtrC family response regulator